MASFSNSRLSISQLYAHNCHLYLSKQIFLLAASTLEVKNAYKFLISILLVSSSLQVSLRLFELTNTLKTVFIPTKDNRRLLHNSLAGIGIALCLYCIGFILLQIPHAQVTSISCFFYVIVIN